ncbi:hypothetical protein BDZ91DRAFT_732587 [Kalaharituber pfeilii]|nr:hypothetical protein BDZ91DRAFT_732587 [Kalaharituber pfeilii]
MDFQSLKEQISNITLYDVKAAVRKAQNVVMNYTEMEAKVREATNNEPWGASTTLMQEIANGTYNYQLLNEIMPMLYKRFTEKSAEEWRQIYKALQLLEFLVKNGSEQVIDDARSHISTIKMLRQFHYIDMNGKDQGINVRNRAKELGELLSDVDRIRAERKKARATKNKYAGVEGSFSSGFGSSGGFGNRTSRYGGFGSDSLEYGGYSGSSTVYGDGGGFGGSSRRGYDDEGGYGSRPGNRQKFEEYDEYEEGASPNARPSETTTSSVKRSQPASTNNAKETIPAATKKAPDVDLLFGDEPSTASTSNGKEKAGSGSTKNPLDDFSSLGSTANDDDDEFGGFEAAPAPTSLLSGPSAKTSTNLSSLISAPPAPTTNTISSVATTIAAPQPRSSQQAANITGLVGMTTPTIQKSPYAPPPVNNNLPSLGSLSMSSSPAPAMNTSYQPIQPNYFASVSSGNPSILSAQSTGGVLSPTPANKPASTTTTKSTSDAFGSIWATAAATGIKKPSSAGQKPSTPVQGSSLAEMAKTKAQSGLWGTSGASATSSNSFGSFGGSTSSGHAGMRKAGGDVDDLLG